MLQCVVFLCICIISPLASHAAAGDEVRASKKIISVVYDDSGSMEGDRWSYANYAMQALIALLNEQDELYITYMSNEYTSVAVNTSDLAGEIAKIQKLDDPGGTPEEALFTARDKLNQISESDATTQFWLVIMTDGDIVRDDGFTVYDEKDLQNMLDSFKGNTMSNNTPLNVVYLGMGAAKSAKADKANGLHTFKVASDNEIVTTMQDMANLVSGRMNPDKVDKVNDNTIKITSKLPLYSISILSQKSDAKVKGAKTAEEDLNVQRNLALDATDLPVGTRIDALYGNAAVINKQNSSGDQQIIPAGEYTVEFSSKVDVNNIVVQVEPAIALKAEISRNGVVIDDTSKLQNGDKVDIKIIPVVPGTDDEIPDSDLPNQISWDIEYEVDGSLADSGIGTSLNGVTLTAGHNIIRGIIDIPGYAPFIKEISFELDEFSYNLGINVSQPSGLSYDRADMKQLDLDDSNTIKFDITSDGIVLTKEEQEQIGVSLRIDDISVTPYSDNNIVYTAGKIKVKCKLEQNDDGSWSLIPDCPGGVPIIGLQAGDYIVKVSTDRDDTVTGEAIFTVVPAAEDAKDVPKILIGLLIFLYILYLLFIKKKFRRHTVHYECWRIREDGRGVLQRGLSDSESLGFFSGHFLLPTKACYYDFHGLRLVAESGGMVMITGNSIAKSVVKYGTSTSNPERHLRAIERHMHKTVKKDNVREATDQGLSNSPIYFKTSDGTNDIWRIWITED